MKTTAVVFEHEKDAALYFDHIIPVDLPHIGLNKETLNITKKLLPKYLLNEINGGEKTYEILGIGKDYYELILTSILENIKSINRMRHEINTKTDNFLKFKDCLDKIMKDDYALLGGKYSKDESKSLNDICSQLINLELINAENASWKQILEIRQDEESIIKLRRLRTFFEDELTNKDINYIKDEISVCLYDYKNACKKHGFEMVQSMLSMIITKETLISSAIGALVNSMYDINNLIVPVSFPVLGIMINLFKAKYDMKQMMAKDPLAYIIDTNKKINT